MDHQLVLRRVNGWYAAVVTLEVKCGGSDDANQILKPGGSENTSMC
jgi:hypothetical protein